MEGKKTLVEPGMRYSKKNSDNRYPTYVETNYYNTKIAKRRALVAKQLADWQENIAKIPVPYRTLTEQEWLEACRHFNGCAFCGKPDISARGMFIPFKLGGRYCSWNIVPSCEACATAISREETPNPFERMETRILMRYKASQAKKLGQSVDTLRGIVDYLEPILMEAANGKACKD